MQAFKSYPKEVFIYINDVIAGRYEYHVIRETIVHTEGECGFVFLMVSVRLIKVTWRRPCAHIIGHMIYQIGVREHFPPSTARKLEHSRRIKVYHSLFYYTHTLSILPRISCAYHNFIYEFYIILTIFFPDQFVMTENPRRLCWFHLLPVYMWY